MDSLNILRGVLMFCHKSLNVLRFPKRHIYQSQNMEICLKENSEEISRVNISLFSLISTSMLMLIVIAVKFYVD